MYFKHSVISQNVELYSDYFTVSSAVNNNKECCNIDNRLYSYKSLNRLLVNINICFHSSISRTVFLT